MTKDVFRPIIKEFALRGGAVKVQGNGGTKILTPAEIDRLFDQGFITARDRLLFTVTFYCACCISEALALTTHDIVGESVTLQKVTTKGSSATRTLPLHQLLARYLKAYNPDVGFWFPRRDNTKPLTRAQADVIFKEACKRVRIKEASTQSMRRTALTNLSNAGGPLWVIREILGHKNLSSLQRYLEVQAEQLVKASGLLK